jgi:hypothetical protein
MERSINYQEIKGKFSTVEEFNGALDYILRIHEQTQNIMELDMDQADKDKRIKILNREINRINKLFREFIIEKRNELNGWESAPPCQMLKYHPDWS